MSDDYRPDYRPPERRLTKLQMNMRKIFGFPNEVHLERLIFILERVIIIKLEKIMTDQATNFATVEAEIAKVKGIVTDLRNTLASASGTGLSDDQVKTIVQDLDSAIAAPAVVQTPVEQPAPPADGAAASA